MLFNTYAEAKAHKDTLENVVNMLSNNLSKYPKGDMGMVHYEVRNSLGYKADKEAYDNAFKRLQTFNKWFMKNYKKEYMAERRRNK